MQAKVPFVCSLRASCSIWASEASRARTRERVYFSRYPPDGEVARRLSFLDVISIDISTRWRFMKCSDTKSKQTQNHVLLTFAWKLVIYAWQVNFSGIMFFFFFFNFFSNWEVRLANWRQIMKRPSTGQARSFLVERRLDETQIYGTTFSRIQSNLSWRLPFHDGHFYALDIYLLLL